MVIDEADTYSILSVAGVAKVNLNATYLTLENGQPVRGNLDDLENYNLLSLLSLTSVSYAYKYDETNKVYLRTMSDRAHVFCNFIIITIISSDF